MRNSLLAIIFFTVAGQLCAQPASTLGTAPPSNSSEVPQAFAASNPDSQWRPTSVQIELVQSRTRMYFAARDGGRFEEAYATFAPTQKTRVPFVAWRNSIEAFNSRAGKANSRAMRKITWYRNSPQGPPGTYAAVDFSSDFTNLALHCGYVIWQEQPDGSFDLLREEDNLIDREIESKLKPGQLEQVRAQFRC
jgi:hypothetical protein